MRGQGPTGSGRRVSSVFLVKPLSARDWRQVGHQAGVAHFSALSRRRARTSSRQL